MGTKLLFRHVSIVTWDLERDKTKGLEYRYSFVLSLIIKLPIVTFIV